ncbi:hypothetical protein [Promicromonospora sp. NPDC023805]|uniref:hypothetical protein n=1 Tax=Promicromonospora sp. NPDC023805 TaxID=3154696 RepID=UPI0033CE626E
MAGEMTVPMLPCGSIDAMVEFYGMLGFRMTYSQKLPNPYVALEREDINLHFFGIRGFKPEDSYGSCLVLVPDTGELFRAFAEGMRATHGKILVSGIPRMTRPRVRKNSDNMSGFTVIDPGGNWIRVMAMSAKPADEEAVLDRLAASLRSAVVMGDSHGKHRQAARILDAALERNRDTAGPIELLEALAYRAELAARAGDDVAAREFLDKATNITLTAAQRRAEADVLASLDDLAAAL